MVKRLFWFGSGVGLGLYAGLRFRRRIDRYRPENIVGTVAQTVRQRADRMRDAWSDGWSTIQHSHISDARDNLIQHLRGFDPSSRN